MFTHDFYATSVEELQLGIGSDAIVYAVDRATGALLDDAGLEPLVDLPDRASQAALFETFGR